jgi:hypothetical protein
MIGHPSLFSNEKRPKRPPSRRRFAWLSFRQSARHGARSDLSGTAGCGSCSMAGCPDILVCAAAHLSAMSLTDRDRKVIMFHR